MTIYLTQKPEPTSFPCHRSSRATALRELHEETGYGGGDKNGGHASVRSISPIVVADPGMTNANMQLVVVDVKLESDDLEPPKAKLEAVSIESSILHQDGKNRRGQG